ncbi:MAG: winged helix-turn-helix transcriptional regulator [Deltaproteobacteria bacterium]|nr:winged helix-turn-helix transcriptional regulator [Deltaproteobacteria bacterium]
MKSSAELFKLLSVDTRIDIVEALKKKSLSVGDIAETVGVTQSAASQHLRVLKDAELVTAERQGLFIYYSLDREALEGCRARLNRICTCGCTGSKSRKA